MLSDLSSGTFFIAVFLGYKTICVEELQNRLLFDICDYIIITKSSLINYKQQAVSEDAETQFSRAARQLGIEVICAHSPEAKSSVIHQIEHNRRMHVLDEGMIRAFSLFYKGSFKVKSI